MDEEPSAPPLDSEDADSSAPPAYNIVRAAPPTYEESLNHPLSPKVHVSPERDDQGPSAPIETTEIDEIIHGNETTGPQGDVSSGNCITNIEADTTHHSSTAEPRGSSDRCSLVVAIPHRNNEGNSARTQRSPICSPRLRKTLRIFGKILLWGIGICAFLVALLLILYGCY